ncbi:MAG: glutamine synthetase beta-grasp domain-containing protein, partial [Candidatus Omnitrophica bacterium]|nr:glutamine synthetase beta-grasp domain-containing protein [Candidatus Omnitrophota bacterium]
MPRGTVAAARRAVRVTRSAAAATVGANHNAKLTAPITEDAVKKVWQIIRQNKITVVDLKFNDLPGLWQHFSIPVEEVAQSAKEGIWVDGIGFDGSSIRGFQKIQESDMNLFPDPSTAVLDPVCETPTLSIVCDIYDPLTHEPYSRDPRYIAKKAEAYLKKTGIGDVSYWGPEPE